MDINIILTYGVLLLSVISTWTKFKLFNKIPIWLLFLTISFVLAITFKRASYLSLIYTLIFGFSVYYNYQQKNILLFFLVLALSIPLFFHLPIIDFNNYKYLHNISLTSHSSPYNLYFNLDKTLIGIFIIAFGFEYKKIEVLPILKLFVINLLLMVVIFFILAIVLGYSKFEPKLPSFSPVWILTNLFFTCIAEEALFRKLIQQKIYDSLTGRFAIITSILVASVTFGLVHFKGGISYMILASLAGVFYGYIYYKTKRIESSILLHFTFNLTHFLFFTYPALK
ncbi:CPBP family intramembrane glutamic endopeptidase [Tenacibaculum sp. nBUS_03]|uniref:CPBP family intramembrane glutamic endopeptidase n=1 Tax=Tenacibaculum sp. nBUS_03 TaxID=3395320 RepID=UPI003EB8EF1C